MLDLHNHLLYGIDDGAKDLNESLALFNIYQRDGINQVVMTPHFSVEDDLSLFLELRNNNYSILKKALKEAKLDVEVKIGAEILFSIDIMNMPLQDLVIEGTNYLLLEFPTRSYISNLKERIMELQSMGYDIIFAHIERYGFLRDDLKLMKELVDMGVIFQINASSFIDEPKDKFVRACVKHNLVHLVASDAHGLDKRKPNLKEAYKAIESNYGSETVNYFKDNAESIFNNELVDRKEATNIKKFLKSYY